MGPPSEAAAPVAIEIAKGIATGLAAGCWSGLLGVSPGGILVPVASLILGLPQHLAQAVSLVAQAPPTSLSGVSAYSKAGQKIPLIWIVILAAGFMIGGATGAILTKRFTDAELRWMFVAYLLLLALVSMLRRTTPKVVSAGTSGPERPAWASLALIGAIGGTASGLLGIGGGLAVTALSALLLRISQHRAQALSLMMTALPLTLPAAWMYVRQGARLPWWAIAGMIAGLAVGARLGAIFANRLAERTLRILFVALILALAIYMGATA